MSKLKAAFCASTLLFLGSSTPHDRFAKYKRVEAYEIRPGTLMMPRYSADGQVCEIGLEKRHYSPELIRLDSSFSREEIDQLVDELVPAEERGAKTGILAGRDLITLAGPGITTTEEYERVSIHIYGSVSHVKRKKVVMSNVAAVIVWKNQKCE